MLAVIVMWRSSCSNGASNEPRIGECERDPHDRHGGERGHGRRDRGLHQHAAEQSSDDDDGGATDTTSEELSAAVDQEQGQHGKHGAPEGRCDVARLEEDR